MLHMRPLHGVDFIDPAASSPQARSDQPYNTTFSDSTRRYPLRLPDKTDLDIAQHGRPPLKIFPAAAAGREGDRNDSGACPDGPRLHLPHLVPSLSLPSTTHHLPPHPRFRLLSPFSFSLRWSDGDPRLLCRVRRRSGRCRRGRDVPARWREDQEHGRWVVPGDE